MLPFIFWLNIFNKTLFSIKHNLLNKLRLNLCNKMITFQWRLHRVQYKNVLQIAIILQYFSL